jgi:hypothetical protein
MRPADDQAVAFHASQRVGHRRLFDVEAADQLVLRQSILGPERQQHGKLTRHQAERLDPLGQRPCEDAREAIDKVAGRAVPVESHAPSSHLHSPLCKTI